MSMDLFCYPSTCHLCVKENNNYRPTFILLFFYIYSLIRDKLNCAVRGSPTQKKEEKKQKKQ